MLCSCLSYGFLGYRHPCVLLLQFRILGKMLALMFVPKSFLVRVQSPASRI